MKKRILSLVCLTLALVLALGSYAMAADALLPYTLKDFGVTVLTPSSLYVMDKSSMLPHLSAEEIQAYGGADAETFPQVFFLNKDSTLKGSLIVVKDDADPDFTTLTDAQLNAAAGELTDTYTRLYDSVAIDTGFVSSSNLKFIHCSLSGSLGGKLVAQEQFVTVKDGLSITLTFTAANEMSGESSALALAVARGIRVSKSGFADMAGHWADASVAKTVELGLFKGTSAAVFSPDRTISRAELVTALFRLYESKTGVKDESKACTLVFTDVSCNSWYLPAVNWAVEKNVVTGSDRRFRPNDPVTREELTAILYRFDALLRGKRADTDARTLASAASDAASVSSWAVGSMNWALKNKYLTGMNGLLAPKAGTTRAQAAAILARYLAA